MSTVGRPAGPARATTEVVLTAALDLLLSEGLGALTAQRLHQATGVSRSTIYRHWETPTRVLEALIDVAPPPPHPTSGDPVADAHAEVDLFCDRLRDKPVAAFLQALLAADDSALELRQRYVDGIAAPFRRRAEEAGLDGEQVDDAVAAIVAPLVLDALVARGDADRARAHRAVDRHLHAPDGSPTAP
ncbi:TetR/AcrR family transcriptional regulator [Nocardioides sp. zg-ZUI104]|uniref:TetR/AcrR family transcriptional regulator n=1 Tax=Nocardioides faecalis TaxID=2803858 RepID=UPI001BCEF1B2|nr:TetR/AcrR family transcriptional regulator [Nocardioides faecalis]MBS4754258.1 TetR/AcrR family transcriptional regulator [Nocardioides faecalis]